LILLCIHNPHTWNRTDFKSEFLSTYEEVDNACNWIDQKLNPGMIPASNDRDLVLLCIREALLNAVEHGNNHKSTAHF